MSNATNVSSVKPLGVLPSRDSDERPLIAIGLVLLAMAVFSAMDVISKVLVADYSPLQIMWVRYATNLLVLVPFIAASRGRALRTGQPLIQFIRGFAIMASGILFMVALGSLALAEATAIGFVSPLLVTALSIPILGEKVGIRRWTALVVGFIGILIIIQPGTAAFDPAALFPVLSAASWACGLVVTRRMKTGEPALTTLFYSGVVGFVILGLVQPWVWHSLTADALVLMLTLGVFNTAGQYVLILGYQRGAASMLAPFSYSQIIWSTLGGFLVFGTVPGLFTGIGAAIVAASGLYVLHRERVIRGQTS